MLLLALWAGAGAGVRAAAAERSWQDALSAMPLPASPALARSNAIRLIVSCFRSNAVVQAVVVLPGLVDDFHLIHRDVPLPGLAARNLAEAIVALTNLTAMRIALTDSRLLLLHTESDRLVPSVQVEHPGTADGLRQRRGLLTVEWTDVSWVTVQPRIRKGLGLGVRPEAGSADAGHFERLNLAAQGPTDWQLLEMIALTTGTRVVIERRRVRFERR